MTVSVFRGRNTSNIDAIADTTPGPNVFRCGALVAGGAKTANRAAIHTFDLSSTPDEGPPMPVNAVVTLGELLGNVTSILGSGWTLILNHLSDDHGAAYDYTVATGQTYDGTNLWRNQAASPAVPGDVDAPPASLGFACPTSLGDQTIAANITAYVLDAIANRARILRAHWSVPGAPSVSQHMTAKASPLTDSDVVRLRVTWADPAAARIDHPTGVTLPGAAPTPAAPPGRAGVPSPAGLPARPHQPIQLREGHGITQLIYDFGGVPPWWQPAPHFAR